MLTTKLHTELRVAIPGAPESDRGRIFKNEKGVTVFELPRYGHLTVEDLQQVIVAMKEFQEHA